MLGKTLHRWDGGGIPLSVLNLCRESGPATPAALNAACLTLLGEGIAAGSSCTDPRGAEGSQAVKVNLHYPEQRSCLPRLHVPRNDLTRAPATARSRMSPLRGRGSVIPTEAEGSDLDHRTLGWSAP